MASRLPVDRAVARGVRAATTPTAAVRSVDVDTVGGLLAQRLGRVPLPGDEAQVEGLRLRAEGSRDSRGRMRVTLGAGHAGAGRAARGGADPCRAATRSGGRQARHAGAVGPGPHRGGRGAAVRDTDGRTYAAATVALASLRLSALQAAVAAAVSSGAPGLEAAAVVGGRPDRTRSMRSTSSARTPRSTWPTPRQLVDVVPAASGEHAPIRRRRGRRRHRRAGHRLRRRPHRALASRSSSASRGWRRTRPATTPT